MEDLKRMAVFAAVVQHGSMSGAARALGMSTSAVSQQVRKLESDGGVTLLHRSTRKLALTEAGQRYHARCAAMWAAAEQARAELAASRDAPSGELRLSATVGFARHIAPALGELLAAHPALRLRLLVDDSPIDLINARIDLAVRFGRLSDSTWAARRLCGMQWYLAASPQWLATHGAPRDPDALLTHSWLGFAREGVGCCWTCTARRANRARCGWSHALPATTSCPSSRCARPGWGWRWWAAWTRTRPCRPAGWCGCCPNGRLARWTSGP